MYLRIVVFIWNVIVILMHACCLIILTKVERRNTNNTQKNDKICLKFLSVSITVSCVFYNVVILLWNVCKFPNTFSNIINLTMVLSLYIAMFFLTLERFLIIYYHLRYEMCWFRKNRDKLVIVTNLLSIFICCCFGVLFAVGIISKRLIFWILTIVILCSNSFIALTVIIVYVYIYLKFCKANAETKNMIFNHQQKRKIFIPFLIVFTFLIFGTIPHYIAVLSRTLFHRMLWIGLDGFANAIVYVLLEKDIRVCIQRCIRQLVKVPRQCST